ncbi:hypothetical protein GIB67_020769 [Kingdonia uniflora]|uniref:Branched-chain alpha-ketoacid dehydrogenase kinase/Pyruvate dehydrogenase kinase N-terminal domain-containing protein n=1 Tax=Kingdonia uniflora TaxID=39325 RepID=A0A7J7M747_9MAGN|nr:hypothetical protein GIB67_020769 [Kingdonia uniflora]
MMELGSKPTKRNLLISSQFLHTEPAIRIAMRAIELEDFSHGLSDEPAILKGSRRISFKGLMKECLIIELDMSKKQADMQGFTTRAYGVR